MTVTLNPKKAGLLEFSTSATMTAAQLGRLCYHSGADEKLNPYSEWTDEYIEFIEAYDLCRWENFVIADTRSIEQIDLEF